MLTYIGKSAQRVDAVAKVTGRAKFTGDYSLTKPLCAKVIRSTIAHGYVKNYDISKALEVAGVYKIVLPEDLPNYTYSPAGYSHSLCEDDFEIKDKNILTRNIRFYGDEIAAVIAETELAALRAAELIKVEYEQYPVYLDPEQSIASGAKQIHKGKSNIIKDTVDEYGDIKKGFDQSDFIIEEEYQTSTVQHCHLENNVAYAYLGEDNRWVCVSSTQIPHICRRILGVAFNRKWSDFRVIKPFVGGGFGNKQDVTIEPIVVGLSMLADGRPVKLTYTREETMTCTRVRHPIKYKMKIGVTKDGIIKAFQADCVCNSGAYASHGHAIVSMGPLHIRSLYKIENFYYAAKSVYTNACIGGAMRGYGVPQVTFATESIIQKAADKIGMDSIEFRIRNMVEEGTIDNTTGITQYTNKIDKCLQEGAKAFEFSKKKNACLQYKSGDKRRGVGVASFSYCTGTWPIGFETSGCHLRVNQDGTIKMLIGAAELGQGSDTALIQIAAETLDIPIENFIVEFKTDTDIAPFDTGAYASRQTYVSGSAVKKAAEQLKEKIYEAVSLFEKVEKKDLTISSGNIINKTTGNTVSTLKDIALKTYYDLDKAAYLSAEASVNHKFNAYSTGCSFAEVEVDIKTGKIKLVSLLSAHDSGRIINPLLASGQIEGGMFMGAGYGLWEELKYNPQTGKQLNNNLLDYKFPTIMDIPDLQTIFIESDDPTGPYGNKSVGEPPSCSPAAAIRNAVLDAVGIEFNSLPLSAQKVSALLNKMSNY